MRDEAHGFSLSLSLSLSRARARARSLFLSVSVFITLSLSLGLWQSCAIRRFCPRSRGRGASTPHTNTNNRVLFHLFWNRSTRVQIPDTKLSSTMNSSHRSLPPPTPSTHTPRPPSFLPCIAQTPGALRSALQPCRSSSKHAKQSCDIPRPLLDLHQVCGSGTDAYMQPVTNPRQPLHCHEPMRNVLRA